MANDRSNAPITILQKSACALEHLVSQYSQPLSRYFSRRVRDQSDVPDLVQDVLLRLSRLKDFSQISRPESYLFATAANTLRDKARRDITRARDQHQPLDAEKDCGADFSPDRLLAGKQAIQALEAAIKSLPERTRDVFVLRALEEQTTAKVATALGVSTRSVEMHYAKALAHVAAEVAEYIYE